MIEIIASSIEDIKHAYLGGAERIELCEDLPGGGFTPSKELLRESLKANLLPLFVMLRPRKEGFVYTKEEIKALRKAAQEMEEMGVRHVVFGALTLQGLPDLLAIEEIFGGTDLTLTFHRAFDESSDLTRSLEMISSFERITHILTSGGPGSAADNLPALRDIIEKSRATITVGSGVSAQTLPKIQEALSGLSYDLHVGSAVRDGSASAPVLEEKVRTFVELARCNR